MTKRLRLLPLLLLLASCSGDDGGRAPANGPTETRPDPEGFQGRVFERNVVFLSPRADSTLLVAWLISARTHASGVRREVRGLLARGDTWEPFFTDEWESPPTRQPWKPLPRGRMRLVVGNADALEQILFDEGPRQLEVWLQEPVTEWTDQRGESLRLLSGTLVLSSARVPGWILDLTRGRTVSEGSGGDWAVLLSGDSVQVVLHAPFPVAPRAGAGASAWTRRGSQETQWPELSVDWGETRAFERARRDVPVRWSASSPAGDLEVDLTVRAAQLQAGTGEGPQLPVDALFAVTGTVRIDTRVLPVRGLLRHLQP